MRRDGSLRCRSIVPSGTHPRVGGWRPSAAPGSAAVLVRQTCHRAERTVRGHAEGDGAPRAEGLPHEDGGAPRSPAQHSQHARRAFNVSFPLCYAVRWKKCFRRIAPRSRSSGLEELAGTLLFAPETPRPGAPQQTLSLTTTPCLR